MDCPAIPKSWEDMIIPEEYKKTTDGKPFTIFEERIPGKYESIWGFASESGLEVMRAASDWFIDGTFEIMEDTMFMQLYIVVCKVNKVNIPCAFFCLPNKEYPTYKMILECLINKGAGSPDRIHMDFEASALRAVRECFPSSKIIGCDFHFKNRIHSTALGTVAEDHPTRRKQQRERKEQLKRVVEQFDSVSLEDFMNMVIAHYND